MERELERTLANLHAAGSNVNVLHNSGSESMELVA